MSSHENYRDDALRDEAYANRRDDAYWAMENGEYADDCSVCGHPHYYGYKVWGTCPEADCDCEGD